MLINQAIVKVYPLNFDNSLLEGTNYDSAIKRLGTELDRIYNKGGTWKIEGVDPTLSEVGELYDVYKHLVHDHVSPGKIETISKNVSDILQRLGFNLEQSGIGWKIAE